MRTQRIQEQSTVSNLVNEVYTGGSPSLKSKHGEVDSNSCASIDLMGSPYPIEKTQLIYSPIIRRSNLQKVPTARLFIVFSKKTATKS